MEYSFFKQNIFYSFLDCNYDFGLQPISVGYERCNEQKARIGPRAKMHYVLHFVLDGTGYYQIDGQTYTVGKNTLFVIPPGAVTTYFPNTSDPWQYLWVEFGGYCSKQLMQDAFAHGKVVYTPADPAAIKEEFAAMADNFFRVPPPEYALATIARILNICNLLIGEHSLPKHNKENGARQKIHGVVNYIAANLHDSELSVRGLAQKFFFSEAHLSRLFKQVIGIPPVQYIIEQRINKACQMLDSKSFGVSEIADAVGYKDPFYFSKEFKRIMKCSPTEYMQHEHERK